MQTKEEVAISMNTDQLWSGELADGTKMPDYSERSVMVFGKRPGPWQAYDTGDLYKGVFMNASKFPIVFGSRSRNTGIFADALASKGGNPDEIFGTNKPNTEELARQYALPDLQAFVRSLIRIR